MLFLCAVASRVASQKLDVSCASLHKLLPVQGYIYRLMSENSCCVILFTESLS